MMRETNSISFWPSYRMISWRSMSLARVLPSTWLKLSFKNMKELGNKSTHCRHRFCRLKTHQLLSSLDLRPLSPRSILNWKNSTKELLTKNPTTSNRVLNSNLKTREYSLWDMPKRRDTDRKCLKLMEESPHTEKPTSDRFRSQSRDTMPPLLLSRKDSPISSMKIRMMFWKREEKLRSMLRIRRNHCQKPNRWDNNFLLHSEANSSKRSRSSWAMPLQKNKRMSTDSKLHHKNTLLSLIQEDNNNMMP